MDNIRTLAVYAGITFSEAESLINRGQVEVLTTRQIIDLCYATVLEQISYYESYVIQRFLEKRLTLNTIDALKGITPQAFAEVIDQVYGWNEFVDSVISDCGYSEILGTLVEESTDFLPHNCHVDNDYYILSYDIDITTL